MHSLSLPSHSSSYCCSRTFHALISKTPYSLSQSLTRISYHCSTERSVMASDSGDNIETKQRQQLPQLDQRGKLPCPRCTSTNTKFCYFNNYNLSQPRHFCKSCRRYWTQGGTLRNIPIGGGTRKTNKRPRSSPQSELASSFSSVLSEPFMEKAGEVGFNFGLNEMGFGFGRLFWTMENTDELVDNVFSMPEPAIFNPGKGFE